jgi:hypothetical protein
VSARGPARTQGIRSLRDAGDRSFLRQEAFAQLLTVSAQPERRSIR